MRNNLEIYAGLVMGKPQMLTIYKISKKKKSIEDIFKDADKKSTLLNTTMDLQGDEKFVEYANKHGVKLTSDYSRRKYMLIAHENETYWGDKKHTMIMFVPSPNPLPELSAKMLPKGIPDMFKPALYTDVERIY